MSDTDEYLMDFDDESSSLFSEDFIDSPPFSPVKDNSAPLKMARKEKKKLQSRRKLRQLFWK